MRREDLRAELERLPFRPFRMCLSDGATYDIPHPDYITLMERATTIVHIPDTDQQTYSPEHFHIVVLHHITRLEPLGMPVAETNGG